MKKAHDLITNNMVSKTNKDTWKVKSMSRDISHTVKWNGTGGNCTCECFKFRGWCYHIEAVKVFADKVEQPILDEELL